MILLVVYMALLIPFFKPSLVTQSAMLSLIYNIAQVIVSVFVMFDYIKKKKFSHNILIIIFMEAILFISSLMNGLDMIDIIKNIIQTVILCMLIEDLAKKNIKILFKALKLIFNILLFINFIFVIKYPFGIRVGLYNSWLLGAKNAQIMYILPAIFCTYIDGFIVNMRNKKSIVEFLFVLFISSYTLYVVQSSTSIIVLLIFTLLMIMSNSKFYAQIGMKFITMLYIIVFLFVIVFQSQTFFSTWLFDLFDKDATFTGRTKIWERSIEYIKEKPYLGYGLEPSEIRIIKMNNISALNCHNMLLEILYDGGIILFIIFSVFWIRLCGYVDDFSKKNNQILKSVIIAYLIELLTEVFVFEVLLWIFVLIIAISQKEEGINNVEK